MPPGVQGLLDDEEVFVAPVTAQAAGQGVAAGFDAMVFERGELLRVTLAGEDGQTGDAGQVADDVVDLEVHLGEGLLQMLHMAGSVTDEIGAMAQEGADGSWRARGRPSGGIGATDNRSRRSCGRGGFWRGGR